MVDRAGVAQWPGWTRSGELGRQVMRERKRKGLSWSVGVYDDCINVVATSCVSVSMVVQVGDV